MNRSPETMDELLDRIIAWAEGNPDVRAAFLVGSRARTEVPADEWSDLDVPLIAVNPEQYLATTEWLSGCEPRSGQANMPRLSVLAAGTREAGGQASACAARLARSDAS